MEQLIKKACIISYYNSENFNLRTKNLSKLINYFLNNNLQVYIIAQKWPNEIINKYKNNNVNIINYDKPLWPGGARNEFIKNYFYNSNDDFCVISDDDLLLYDYDNSLNILMFSEKLIKCDLIGPRFCTNPPNPYYNNLYKQTKKIYLTRKLNTAGGFLILKNFKKYYNEELYFRDYINNLHIHDDLDFNIRLRIKNKNIKEIFNLRCYPPPNVSTVYKDISEGRIIRDNTYNNLLKEYNIKEPLITNNKSYAYNRTIRQIIRYNNKCYSDIII